MAQSKFIGVDACPCGWFSVGFSNSGVYEFKAFFLFQDLLAYYKEANLILVDIPIGLPDGRGERLCDKQARRRLHTNLKRSVFRVPTRAAVAHLANCPQDKEGAKNVEYNTTGQFNPNDPKSLSTQTLGIMPKIAEVDSLLPRTGRPLIREVHPEICFWALNNGQSISLSKHEDNGINKRIQLLSNELVEPRTQRILDEAWLKYQNNCVGKDDILDALAAAVNAYRGSLNQLQTFTEPPRRNEQNLPTRDEATDLPMEMVFWQPPPPNPD